VLEVSKAGFWEHAVQCEHSEEIPFTYAASNKQIVSGVVDLMYKDAAAWQIIDYKTDLDVTGGAASYEHQTKMYECALASVGIEKTVSQIYPVRLKAGVSS
jgi:ATP-dependent exoDNAse (exonuclease V) beta subunit